MASQNIVSAPSRALQIGCAVAALVGFLPWGIIFDGMVLGAIESHAPLTMSVIAWFVLLVPVWVLWFAFLAWTERDVSARPAILMAIPAVVITALMITLPVFSPGP